ARGAAACRCTHLDFGFASARRAETKPKSEKNPKLGGGSLLVIFPTSPKRVITLLSLSQRDRGECFQIWDFAFAR
ncbi:hypothetical protein, partial [Cephaloticoccus capnophilus]|uniref:hypothetical protein n=1 Tax=Cephaloticoccus capnophilus TaxID=1548208 RepID=UPI001E59C9B2